MKQELFCSATCKHAGLEGVPGSLKSHSASLLPLSLQPLRGRKRDDWFLDRQPGSTAATQSGLGACSSTAMVVAGITASAMLVASGQSCCPVTLGGDKENCCYPSPWHSYKSINCKVYIFVYTYENASCLCINDSQHGLHTLMAVSDQAQ